MKFKPQFKRILWIDKELKRKRTTERAKLLTANMLADMYTAESPDWPAGSRTIRRDIQYMKDEWGAPIERHPDGYYYYTETNFFLPSISITNSELFFTCVAERALLQYKNTPLHSKLSSLFGRIQDCFPSKVTIEPEWVNHVHISFLDTPPRKNDVDIWSEVSRALYNEKALLVKYKKPGNSRASVRKLEPYHLIGCDGAWYLIAYDRTEKMRKGIKLFAINRVTYAERLTASVEIPDDFNPKDYVGSLGVMRESEKYNMKLQFDASCAPYIKERDWFENQEITEKKDGSIVLVSKNQTTHMYQMRRFLMSWGSSVKVLAPKALAVLVQEELKAAAKQYK